MESVERLANKIKNKVVLAKEEIYEIIKNYTDNLISDDDFLPFLRAVYKYGLTDKELFYLTMAMVETGKKLDLKELKNVVDKHSTGGVGDTTTLIVVPICASLKTNMLKLSGRGLGFTGGTCDKLESFKGYKTELPINEAINLVKQNGGCILTTSKELSPADKKIYALRNKSGLVDSIPLIASSIMSKKIAGGANIIVLDVKYGNGAFMKDKKSAILLGKKMKKIGKYANKKVIFVLGKMNQPLGYNIGPKLETMEAISVLKGESKSSLYKESVKLATHCVRLSKHIPYFIAKYLVKKSIKNKSALNKLKKMVSCQGGSLDLFDEKYKKPTLIVKSQTNGVVKGFNTKEIGEIVANMGTVKIENDDVINYENGVITLQKINDKVKINDPLFYIYANDMNMAKSVKIQLLKCIEIK